MAHHLIQIVYESENALGWSGVLTRVAGLRLEIEKRGGKLEVAGLAMGQNNSELVAIYHMPDYAGAETTAQAINALAGGGIRTVRTTPFVVFAQW